MMNEAGTADSTVVQSPFQELTLRTRVRQLLHTHQGRDKLFKVLQYTLRLQLWWRGIDPNLSYVVEPGTVTTTEKNLMTTVNTRRLFRVGRFMGEVVRFHVTLIKCSELIYAPTTSAAMSLFLQAQMVADIVARALMLVKSVCEDIAYLAQKGFLHTHVADRLLRVSAKCALPVLLVDLLLNTLRIAQGVRDATAPEQRKPAKVASLRRQERSFSLLSEYDTVDKIRRRTSLTSGGSPTPPPQTTSPHQPDLLGTSAVSSREELDDAAPSGTPTPPVEESGATFSNNSIIWQMANAAGEQDRRDTARDDPNTTVLVPTYTLLFWRDFELHWIGVTQLKLLLDIVVAVSVLQRWKRWNGAVSFAGFLSGLLSVYRVWTYGR